MKIIATDAAPQAIGAYSQAIAVNDIVYTSGQISIDPTTGAVVGDTIEEQTHRVCRNLTAVLEASGSSLLDVIKTTCYLANMSDFAAFNSIYAEYFTGRPARSCVSVRELPRQVLVEIDVIAVINSRNLDT